MNRMQLGGFFRLNVQQTKNIHNVTPGNYPHRKPVFLSDGLRVRDVPEGVVSFRFQVQTSQGLDLLADEGAEISELDGRWIESRSLSWPECKTEKKKFRNHFLARLAVGLRPEPQLKALPAFSLDIKARARKNINLTLIIFNLVDQMLKLFIAGLSSKPAGKQIVLVQSKDRNVIRAFHRNRARSKVGVLPLEIKNQM